MMRSLYSGVSGLKNHQTRMDVVGNNISNVNTTGFKSSRVTFSDTLSQTLSGASSPTSNIGGINPKQIGLGSATASIDTLFTDGSVQSTGVNTDLCLSGNGLFIVKNGDSVYYTRNGNFKFDANGYYVNSDGLKVQGWCASTPGGTYDTKAQPSEINIPSGETMAAAATTETKFTKNLNSAEPTITSIKATDNKGNTLTVAEDSTDIWACGEDYQSEIADMQVEFKGNMSSVGTVTGSYAMGKNYAFDTDLTATGTNGDVMNIPNTLNTKINMSTALSSYKVNSVNGNTVNLSNGCTITNNSNSNYTVNFTNATNSDTIYPALFTATAANANYAVGGTIALNVTNVVQITNPATGATTITNVTLTDPTTGQSYTINSPSSTTNYWDGTGQAPQNPVTQVTVSIGSITYNATGGLKEIAGQANGDAVAMTTGTITPADGLTVSNLDLTNKDGTFVDVNNKDTTSYRIGDDYESTLQSLTLGMSDKTTTTETSGAYVQGNSKPLTTIMAVYDSLGNSHNVMVYLTKTKIDSTNGNQWTASINPDGSGRQVLTGSDGKETVVEMPDTILQFDTNGGFTNGAGITTMTLSNGATGTQNISMNFTGLTQYSGSNTAFADADGNAAGTLKSVSIDSNGVITGTYTNGLNVARGQVAIAQFNNSAGLTKSGNSLYTESNNSGTPNTGTISDLGCSVTPSALEMSNVDMASELTDMIVTQRGYQSNSKIITVSDELLETLINMKR